MTMQAALDLNIEKKKPWIILKGETNPQMFVNQPVSTKIYRTFEAECRCSPTRGALFVMTCQQQPSN